MTDSKKENAQEKQKTKPEPKPERPKPNHTPPAQPENTTDVSFSENKPKR